jgi:hypothetical protein
MSETYTHNCIKCNSQYSDNDLDAYYCETCNEQRKIIAKEVDKKFSTIPKHKTKSDFQIYDEMCRARGTAFPSIKDMGINLK